MALALGILFLLALAYEASQGAEAPWTIAGVASNAGFSGVDLITAVAIAYAESSGNPNAVGDVTLGRSIGLWQINLAAHPEYSEDSLYDPQTNANAAFAIYQAAGDSFSPWTTFNNGAYQNNVDQAQSDVGDLSADDSGDDEEQDG
jgi:soluble lytic murein transglycosylase-like protein